MDVSVPYKVRNQFTMTSGKYSFLQILSIAILHLYNERIKSIQTFPSCYRKKEIESTEINLRTENYNDFLCRCNDKFLKRLEAKIFPTFRLKGDFPRTRCIC